MISEAFKLDSLSTVLPRDVTPQLTSGRKGRRCESRHLLTIIEGSVWLLLTLAEAYHPTVPTGEFKFPGLGQSIHMEA